MAYDVDLSRRVLDLLQGTPGLVEKKMFGGVGFILNGNMACGVNGENLIVRVDPGRHAEALAQPFVRPFDMTGRPMKGWVVVEPGGFPTLEALHDWVRQGADYALSLPAKNPPRG